MMTDGNGRGMDAMMTIADARGRGRDMDGDGMMNG